MPSVSVLQLNAASLHHPQEQLWPGQLIPLQVELEVLEDPPAGQEGAAQAGQDLPAAQVAHAARMGHFVRLLDELAVQLVSQRPEVMSCLEDALDDGNRV